MIPKKTCTPAVTAVSQNHPFLTSHKGRRPALWGGLGHWQRHHCDTFWQSLTALPGSVKRLWLAQKHPALATCNAHLSGLQSTLITLTHLAKPDTAHTSFACTVNTVGSVYYSKQDNHITHWMDGLRKRGRLTLLLHNKGLYWYQYFSGGQHWQALGTQTFSSMRSAPQNMPQCLLQGQQLQSRVMEASKTLQCQLSIILIFHHSITLKYP